MASMRAQLGNRGLSAHAAGRPSLSRPVPLAQAPGRQHRLLVQAIQDPSRKMKPVSGQNVIKLAGSLK